MDLVVNRYLCQNLFVYRIPSKTINFFVKTPRFVEHVLGILVKHQKRKVKLFLLTMANRKTSK